MPDAQSESVKNTKRIRQFGQVLSDHFCSAFSFHFARHSAQAKQDDAPVREPEAKNEIAEIFVLRDKRRIPPDGDIE